MGMAEQVPQPPPAERSQLRFEATIHPGEDGEQDLGRVAEFGLDRIPDPEGRVRVLVDLDACARLVERGFQVHLHRAVPVRPLDPRLIPADDEVRAWFEERVRATGRNEAT
jgi:hypothetical protein